jgi:hypothetical protein
MNAADDCAAGLIERLSFWPDGYREGAFAGRRWGATLTRSGGGARLTLYARDLGGAEFVSANFYLLSTGGVARPCEMPVEKVARFIEGFAPDKASVSPASAI